MQPATVSIFSSSSREGEERLAELNLGRTLLVKDQICDSSGLCQKRGC